MGNHVFPFNEAIAPIPGLHVQKTHSTLTHIRLVRFQWYVMNIYCNWSYVPIFAQFGFGALAVMRWHSFQVRKFGTYFWAQRSKKWVPLVALRKIWCSWGNEPFCCKIQYCIIISRTLNLIWKKTSTKDEN